jgi:hypothetical protein
MQEAHYTLAMYLHLARASELRRRWLVRDKLLLLCARQAQLLGLTALAEHCRHRILAHNSGHLLGHYASMEDAVEDDGFQSLWQQADRLYPAEKAEYMLLALGVVLGRAEATYATPEEYLESILGPPPHLEPISEHDLPPASTAESEEEWLPGLPNQLSTEAVAAHSERAFSLLCSSWVLLTLITLAYGMFLFRN